MPISGDWGSNGPPALVSHQTSTPPITVAAIPAIHLPVLLPPSSVGVAPGSEADSTTQT
jgi:hypothetical protein